MAGSWSWQAALLSHSGILGKQGDPVCSALLPGNSQSVSLIQQPLKKNKVEHGTLFQNPSRPKKQGGETSCTETKPVNTESELSPRKLGPFNRTTAIKKNNLHNYAFITSLSNQFRLGKVWWVCLWLKKKEEKKEKKKNVFMLFKNEHFSRRYIAASKCVLANGLDMGFVSFTGNLLVA